MSSEGDAVAFERVVTILPKRLYKADDTFHAIGNTPPRDLFSGLTRPPLDDPLRASRNQYLLPKAFPYYPHILSFACCDMRSVLFTLWLHRSRNLHPVFVISDSSPPVIARDLIILQLAVSAPVNNSSKEFKEHVATVWALWYSLGLTQKQINILHSLLDLLMYASSSDDSWNASGYSSHMSFRDSDTRNYNPTLQRAVEMCNRSVNSMKAAEVETQSLYLAHPLVLSNQLATHLNIFDEITQFYRGGRVTQAISLNAINAADVAFGNPLLFAKSDVYSITHDTLPFNGYPNCSIFNGANWNASEEVFPFLAKDTKYTQFVPDSQFSKNLLLANCTQQLCMWIESVSMLYISNNKFRVEFHCGDALTFCDQLYQEIAVKEMIPGFDCIETSNLADSEGLLPLLLCCSPIAKEHGAIFTDSYDSSRFFMTAEEEVTHGVGMPLPLMPTVLGIRCAGCEGALKTPTSTYSLQPTTTQEIQAQLAIIKRSSYMLSRPITWFKQPLNQFYLEKPETVLSVNILKVLHQYATHCMRELRSREHHHQYTNWNAETFVRILLSLNRNAHIANWNSLIKMLTAEPALAPFLYELQILLNMHQLDIHILPVTTVVGNSGVIPITPAMWPSPLPPVPVLKLKVAGKESHFTCSKIQFDGTQPVALHHFCMFANSMETRLCVDVYNIL